MRVLWGGVLLLSSTGGMVAQTCSKCAEWNAPQAPFRIYGNTYYVGPHGLSSVLIVGKDGDVLIDGDLEQSAAVIAGNIKALGFRVEDVKLILNSHVHFDHAGGIAALQRMSGARVLASPWSAAVLKHGGMARDDPQYGESAGISPVNRVSTLHDVETVRVGDLALTAHFTPGHTPGGTSWTWTSCQDGRCLAMVYADSVSAVARTGWKFSEHPGVVASFDKSFAFLATTTCDVLVTAHPDASDLWGRVKAGKVVDPAACKDLAAGARDDLAKRLAEER